MKNFWGCLVLLAMAAGCSTIGAARPEKLAKLDFGPEATVRLWVLRDVGVTDDRTRALIGAIREEFAPMGLNVEVPWIRDWQRPSFAQEGITRDVAYRPLEAPCDRLLALVGRDARDFVWGALLPEILGAVETRTNTKGYVVAEIGSLNQVLSFSGPADGVVHEFYHLLGCEHDVTREQSYAQVAYIKRLAAESRMRGNDFFPAVSQAGRVYLTRAAVDKRFGIEHAAQTPAASAAGMAKLPRPLALKAR